MAPWSLGEEQCSGPRTFPPKTKKMPVKYLIPALLLLLIFPACAQPTADFTINAGKAVGEIVAQPLLGLFGHIHEGKGTTRLGRTLCINPGSMYEQGRLLGALVKLGRNRVKSYILTTG